MMSHAGWKGVDFMTAIIEMDQVQKHYTKGKLTIKALDDTTISIAEGDVLGLVGESGSGKSTFGKLLIGLEPPTEGEIRYQGAPLWKKNKYVRRKPGELQTVFQDPQSSLDPRMTIKEIIIEPLYALSKNERKQKESYDNLLKLIKRVGLNEEHLERYPHEFSGGQRQRIAIARALITEPSFIILDEPTSALDVSVQAQVLNLLKELKEERGLTYLFISHNMSVIKYMCSKVAVLYKGNIVEIGSTEQLFNNPQHPYTEILLSSLPSLFENKEKAIEGFAETAQPKGENSCIFYEKCPRRTDQCMTSPALESRGKDHFAVCHY